MRVTITGGAGFLGSHVAKAMQEAGHEVAFFDRKSGHDILGDLSALEGSDAVCHLAGVLGTAELFGDIELATQVNVLGTVRVAEWCSKNDAQLTLVNVPFIWNSIYCATKLGAYKIVVAMQEAGLLRHSSVTVWNAFGEGQHTGDWSRKAPRKFVPTFSVAAWQGKPLPVWGDGENLIDPIHTSEVARIFSEAVNFGGGEIFDAGTGNSFTVNEICDFINKHTGNEAGIAYEPLRVGEIPRTNLPATGRGWDLLSKPPEFSWSQLADTIDWYKGKTVVE